MKPYEQGDKWWERPGMTECGRGFNFHSLTLQHGKESTFAKNLRSKAEVRKKNEENK